MNKSKKYSCFHLFGEIFLKAGRWYIFVKRVVKGDDIKVTAVSEQFQGRDFDSVALQLRNLEWELYTSYEVRRVSKFLNF